VSATRPEAFSTPNFAGALSDRDEHDVHQSDAADAKSERPYETSKES